MRRKNQVQTLDIVSVDDYNEGRNDNHRREHHDVRINHVNLFENGQPPSSLEVDTESDQIPQQPDNYQYQPSSQYRNVNDARIGNHLNFYEIFDDVPTLNKIYEQDRERQTRFETSQGKHRQQEKHLAEQRSKKMRLSSVSNQIQNRGIVQQNTIHMTQSMQYDAFHQRSISTPPSFSDRRCNNQPVARSWHNRLSQDRNSSKRSENLKLRKILIRKAFERYPDHLQDQNFIQKLSDEEIQAIEINNFKKMIENQKNILQALKESEIKMKEMSQNRNQDEIHVNRMKSIQCHKRQNSLQENITQIDKYDQIYNFGSSQNDKVLFEDKESQKYEQQPKPINQQFGKEIQMQLPEYEDLQEIKLPAISKPTLHRKMNSNKDQQNYDEYNIFQINEVQETITSQKCETSKKEEDYDIQQSYQTVLRNQCLSQDDKQIQQNSSQGGMKSRTSSNNLSSLKKLKSQSIKNNQQKPRKTSCKTCGGFKYKEPHKKHQKCAKKPKRRQRSQNQNQDEDSIYLPEQLAEFETLQRFMQMFDKKKKEKKEKLSYRKLQKMISMYHPVDPFTNKKFTVNQSITVKDYALKLTDCLGCWICNRCIKFCSKRIKRVIKRKKKKDIKRPKSMQDVPSSASDSGSDELGPDSFKGLSQASKYVGEGAILYLQNMKTFAVLFFILFLINIPLYWLFLKSTDGHQFSLFKFNYKKFQIDSTLFRISTFGNVGSLIYDCNSTTLSHAESNRAYLSRDLNNNREQLVPLNEHYIDDRLEKQINYQQIDLQCGWDKYDYIYEIHLFGFLYTIDDQDNQFTDGSLKCQRIEKPFEIIKASNNYTHKRENIYKEISIQGKVQHAQTVHNVDPECSINKMFKSKWTKQAFDDYFKLNCQNKQKCVINLKQTKFNVKQEILVKSKFQIINLEQNFYDLLSDSCFERIFVQGITSPELIASVSCKKDYLDMLIFQENIVIHKIYIGLVAVVSNIICIILIAYFFMKLKSLNQEYLSIMDDNLIKMSKFTVQINNLKLDKSTQDFRILKMKIWLHFDEYFETLSIDQNQVKYEVADVQISDTDSSKFDFLLKMEKFIKEINQIIHLQSSDQFFTWNERAKMKERKEKLEARILQYKKKYYQLIEAEQSNQAKTQISIHEFVPSINYIWVTFKDNNAPQQCLKNFKHESIGWKFCKKICCIDNSQNEMAEFNCQSMRTKAPVEPDQILWSNLKYSHKESKKRQCLMFIIAIIMSQISLFSNIYLISFQNGVKKLPICDKKKILPSDALFDQKKYEIKWQIVDPKNYDPNSVQLSPKMSCFCHDYTQSGYFFWHANKKIFQDLEQNEQARRQMKNYCLEHLKNIYLKTIFNILTQYEEIILNAFIAIIFSYLGEFVKMHTSVQEQKIQFSYILCLEVFNIGIIQLVKSFEPTGTVSQLINSGGKIQENYSKTGFSSKWYVNVGVKLCFTIFSSSIATNIDIVTELSKIFIKRWYDRGFKNHIKKDIEDDVDDEPNSKQATQDDLEQLYMGSEFEGQLNFSRMMSTLTVCIMYSSGMPALYVVGFIFFIITYLVDKFALFYYYQKTTTLSRVIPIYSNEFLIFIIISHMMISTAMLTNPDIFVFQKQPENLFNLPLPYAGSRKPLEEQNFLEKRLQYLHQQIYATFSLFIFIVYISYTFAREFFTVLFTQIAKILKGLYQVLKGILQYLVSSIRKCCRFKNSGSETNKFDKSNSNQIQHDQNTINTENVLNTTKQQLNMSQTKSEPNSLDQSQTLDQTQHNLLNLNSVTDIMEQEQNSEARIIQEIRENLKNNLIEKEKQLNRFKLMQISPHLSRNIYMELSLMNLRKFYQKSKKELTDIRLFFNMHSDESEKQILDSENCTKLSRVQVIFQEICYTCKITNSEIRRYLECLKKRITDIELTINSHFRLLEPVIYKEAKQKMKLQNKKDREDRLCSLTSGTARVSQVQVSGRKNLSNRSIKNQDDVVDQVQRQQEKNIIEQELKKDPELQFNNSEIYTYEKKLEKLEFYEEKLFRADRSQLLNRIGIKTICRMQESIQQSYFFLDCDDYADAHKIYNIQFKDLAKHLNIFEQRVSETSEEEDNLSV